AYRFGWTGRLSGTAMFFVPQVWLGFPPRVVFATLRLNLLYQFWLHVEWIPKLGPLELVFNTPSHHRVHHAANSEYLDANHGGVLIIFDRLFAHRARRDPVPVRSGQTAALEQPGVDHLPRVGGAGPRSVDGAQLARGVAGVVRPALARPAPQSLADYPVNSRIRVVSRKFSRLRRQKLPDSAKQFPGSACSGMCRVTY